jgi:hypothetical protein
MMAGELDEAGTLARVGVKKTWTRELLSIIYTKAAEHRVQ